MKLEAVDLNLLVALGHLLERQSVSLAAREAGVTQPTMSHSLSRLRELFDDPLLVRAGRKMVPTERAESLRPRVQAALAATRAVLDAPEFSEERPDFKVRIVSDDTVISGLFTPLLALIRERAPDIDLRLTPIQGLVEIEKIHDGRTDLFLGPGPPSFFDLPPGLREKADALVFEPVIRDSMILCHRKGHPRGAGPMTLEEYVQLDHLLVSPIGGEKGRVDRILDERGLRRRIAATTWTFLTGAVLLNGTDLVGMLPRMLVHALPFELVTLEPPFASPAVQIGIHYHPSRRDDPRLQWVIARLHEIARGLPDFS